MEQDNSNLHHILMSPMSESKQIREIEGINKNILSNIEEKNNINSQILDVFAMDKYEKKEFMSKIRRSGFGLFY